jgi:hypothetical protein
VVNKKNYEMSKPDLLSVNYVVDLFIQFDKITDIKSLSVIPNLLSFGKVNLNSIIIVFCMLTMIVIKDL